MTDLHLHILPGVDDGPATMDESLRMLERASEQGTQAIVATPHHDLRFRFDRSKCVEIAAELQRRAAGRLHIELGCEVHLTPENLAAVCASPEQYTIGRHPWLLLELPDGDLRLLANHALDALHDTGLRVVIAHPERNSYIQQHREYADALVDRGCYLQLTGRSLTGGFGNAASVLVSYLMSRRLAHFVASDAHGATFRRAGLLEAYEAVVERYGEPAARTLFHENTKAVLTDGAVRQMPQAPRWYSKLFQRSNHELRKSTAPSLP